MARKLAPPILTEDHWQAILTAAAPLSAAADLERARQEIEYCLYDYAGLLHRSPKELAAARKDWQRIDRLLTELERLYYRFHHLTPLTIHWPLRNLRALRPLRRQASAFVEAYDMRVRARQGRRDPARAWLFERLFAIWTDCSDGKLAVTTPPGGGPPRGPLIRFILAVLTPLTLTLWEHDLPTPDAIRKLARDREEQRRRAARAKR